VFQWIRRRFGRTAVREQPNDSPTELIGGRKRVMGVPYVLPKDDEEINRLDFQHYMLRFALTGNYAAPIQHPRSILDVGCGTGRWAREMAQLFPQASVVGLDVTTPPADESAAELRPPNYSFTTGNVLEGLPFADGEFDFVHMRLLVTAIPADRWPMVVRELIRVTHEGGWVESVESVPARDGGPAMDAIFGWLSELSLRRGVDLRLGAQVGQLMRASGLANVVSREVDIPIGRYGGRVGNMMMTDSLSGFKAVGGILTAQNFTTTEAYDAALTRLRTDLDSDRYHCYSPFFIAYGQRT